MKTETMRARIGRATLILLGVDELELRRLIEDRQILYRIRSIVEGFDGQMEMDEVVGRVQSMVAELKHYECDETRRLRDHAYSLEAERETIRGALAAFTKIMKVGSEAIVEAGKSSEPNRHMRSGILAMREVARDFLAGPPGNPTASSFDDDPFV